MLPKIGPVVLLKSLLNEHRESQYHWVAGVPVGQIMVYKERLWVAGIIAYTLLQVYPSLDWTVMQSKKQSILWSKLDDKSLRDESGQTLSREKSIWYSVLLDNIDLWSDLKIAQKDSWWFGYLGYDFKKSLRELRKRVSRIYEAADL